MLSAAYNLIISQVNWVNFCQGVRLPQQLRDPLMHDMEICIQGVLVQDEIKHRPLQDVIFFGTLYANLIYGSVVTRYFLFSRFFFVG